MCGYGCRTELVVKPFSAMWDSCRQLSTRAELDTESKTQSRVAGHHWLFARWSFCRALVRDDLIFDFVVSGLWNDLLD